MSAELPRRGSEIDVIPRLEFLTAEVQRLSRRIAEIETPEHVVLPDFSSFLRGDDPRLRDARHPLRHGEISHTGYVADHAVNIKNVGTNTHAQVDTHIANTSNPHAVTAAQASAVATADHTKAVHDALLIDADTLDTYHAVSFSQVTAASTITVGAGKDYTTIQAAYNSINSVITGNIIISIDAGTYTENLFLGGKVTSGAYNILFQAATRTTDLSTTCTGGTAGNASTQSTVIKTGAGWTVNVYRGKWLRFTSGALSGEIKVVNGNTTDTITLVGDFFASAPQNGDSFVIESNNVIVVGDHTINPTSVELKFKYLKIQNVIMKQVLVRFYDCWRATTAYDKNKWEYVIVYETRTFQSINVGVMAGGVWTYGSSHDLDECLFYGAAYTFWYEGSGVFPRAGGYLLVHNGTVFDYFARAIWADLMAVGHIWDGSKVRNSKPRIQNCLEGANLKVGSHIVTDVGNWVVYTNNTTNQIADAASYSWIG